MNTVENERCSNMPGHVPDAACLWIHYRKCCNSGWVITKPQTKPYPEKQKTPDPFSFGSSISVMKWKIPYKYYKCCSKDLLCEILDFFGLDWPAVCDNSGGERCSDSLIFC